MVAHFQLTTAHSLLACLILFLSQIQSPNSQCNAFVASLLYTSTIAQMRTFVKPTTTFKASLSDDHPNFTNPSFPPSNYGSNSQHSNFPQQQQPIQSSNTVYLIGRLGSEPTPTILPSGKVVVNLSLAVQRPMSREKREQLFNNNNNNNQNDNVAPSTPNNEITADWFPLVFFPPQSSYVLDVCGKGSKVGIVGTLRNDVWRDKETGKERSRVKVIVRSCDLLQSVADGRSSGYGSPQNVDGNGSGNNDKYYSGRRVANEQIKEQESGFFGKVEDFLGIDQEESVEAE